MNILHITTHLNIGGLTRYILDVSSGLGSKGVNSFVVSSGGEVEKNFIDNGIKLFNLRIKTKFEFHPKLFLVIPSIIGIVKKNKIDVIHCHTRSAQILGCIISKITKVPYVSTCHGFFNPERLSRKLFPCWGKKVIAISNAVKKHLVNDFNVDPDNVSVIFTGVKLENYKTSLTDAEKNTFLKDLKLNPGPIIGTVGRLSPVKGHDCLIRAMRLLKNEIPGINCVIIGDGSFGGNLRELVSELELNDCVHFIRTGIDAKKILPIFDVYVFPSRQEGLGLALLEAMASQRVCIASSVGGIVDIIKNNENGILVEPENVELLSESIKKVIKDKKLSQKLAVNALDTIKNKFIISNTADSMFNFYKKVIKGE